MTNKEQIENLDPPTICDNCIHDEVCGLEGHLEPAHIYCGWKEEKRPQGKWLEESSETGALGIKYTWVRCNRCGWDNSLVIPKNFCPNCGCIMEVEE